MVCNIANKMRGETAISLGESKAHGFELALLVQFTINPPEGLS